MESPADATSTEEDGSSHKARSDLCLSGIGDCILHECDRSDSLQQPSFGLDRKCPKKMLGVTCCGPPRAATAARMWWSWLGSFLGIAVIALMAQYIFNPLLLPSLYGSFGATAVLLYAAPASPLAQPRNLLLGHTASAFIGVSLYKLSIVLSRAGQLMWLAASLSVSVSIVFMHATKCLHPPGGASALIAVISVPVQRMGYLFVVFVFFGALVMMLVAIVVDNAPRHQSYPQHWW